jgi:hypothetical protein
VQREPRRQQEPEGEHRDQDDAGAGGADRGAERHPDRRAEVAAGVAQGVDGIGQRGRAAGEVEEPDGREDDEHHTETDAHRDAELVVLAPPEQDRGDGEEGERDEGGPVAEQGRHPGGDAAPHGAGEVGRQRQAAEGGEREEADRHRVGAVTPQLGPGRLPDRGGLGGLAGLRLAGRTGPLGGGPSTGLRGRHGGPR